MKTLSLLLLIFSLSFSAFEVLPSSSRADGMAQAFSPIANDLSAIYINPAGLVQITKSLAAFNLKSIHTGLGVNHSFVSICLPQPKKSQALGLGISYLGFFLYSEKTLAISYAYSLSENIAIGSKFSFYQLSIKDLGQALSYGVDLGVLAKIYQKWRLGINLANLNQPSIGKEQRSEIKPSFRFGIGYLPFLGFVSAIEVFKKEGEATSFRMGYEFEILEERLSLQAGIASEPFTTNFGLSLNLSNKRIGYAFTYYPDLSSLTQNIEVSIQF